MTANLAITQKVVNGSEGTVKDIKYDLVGGKRQAKVVYLEIPGAGIISSDLQRDMVPIFPHRTKFQVHYKTSAGARQRTITRYQLPVVPAYAYTDYKSQGRSLKAAVVDLYSARTIQGVYVMLSRVTTIQGLAILCPFSPMKIYKRISQELRHELDRIDFLDESTRAMIEGAV